MRRRGSSRTSVDERRLEQNPTQAPEQGWIPVTITNKLREIVGRYLDGRRDVDKDVEQLASSLAAAAHAGGHAPERLLIAIRELWRGFALSQHDRLQLAALYGRLVRRTIDRYYED